jgi:hypothetical protein
VGVAVIEKELILVTMVIATEVIEVEMEAIVTMKALVVTEVATEMRVVLIIPLEM